MSLVGSTPTGGSGGLLIRAIAHPRPWQDARVRHSLAGRAESPLQARLLAELRDEGPLSKAQLATALQVSRTTVGAEVARLGELGLAVEAGPAASRGGRRSTIVDLSPDIR